MKDLVEQGRKLGRKLHRLLIRPWRDSRAHGKSLIAHVLGLQMLFMLTTSILIISGLWVFSNWLVQENLINWGRQWSRQIEELSLPLFLEPDQKQFFDAESYARKYPEIVYVRYYSVDGNILHEDIVRSYNPASPLGSNALDKIAADFAADQKYYVERSPETDFGITLARPVWQETFADDDLLTMASLAETPSVRKLLGHLEVGLDFSGYRATINSSLFRAALVIGLGFLLITLYTYFVLRSGLRPLQLLQQPLKRLAMGNTDFHVERVAHREINGIIDTLNVTVEKLRLRDEKLYHLANFDQLTGVQSRHRFMESLNAEIHTVDELDSSSALLFVDLDQFKCVNDSIGHNAADKFLYQAAQHIQSQCRGKDRIGRFGGDEFTVILRDVSRREAVGIANDLVESMWNRRFIVAGQVFTIPCSVGVVMINSARYGAEELLAQADMACHEAKMNGRSRCEVYRNSGGQSKQRVAEFGWSQRIRNALENDDFALYYQPIAKVDDFTVSHYEVLLRMEQDGKIIMPAEFLPAAEQFGLSPAIDLWVIENALRELAIHQESRPELSVTINVSGGFFELPGVVEHLRREMQHAAIAPDSLIFEITEQVAVSDVTVTGKIIEEIRTFGCRFAIDDFGTGYSSFNYLRALPVDFVKIDGSFIQNLCKDTTDKSIVQAIGAVSAASGKQTIAEFVGDAETLKILRQLDIDYAQGYFIGKPTREPQKVKKKIANKRRSRKTATKKRRTRKTEVA